MRMIARVRRDVPLPLFITLTYPKVFPTPAGAKKNIFAFFNRLRRAFPGLGLIWKLEPQKRGAPHFHMLAWGAELQELRKMVPQAWYEIAGGGDEDHLKWHRGQLGNGNKHCVQQVRSWRGVWSYASKYLGKTFEVDGWKWPGRFWGVVNRGVVPFGVERSIFVSRSEALTIQRYQRRFAGKLRSARTMNLLCDASQWAKKLELEKRLTMRNEFTLKFTKCWKCGKEIPVYTWEGKVLWDERCPEEGRPPTLRKEHHSYWANYCMSCGVIQGDWYLYMEPEAPFFGIITEYKDLE